MTLTPHNKSIQLDYIQLLLCSTNRQDCQQAGLLLNQAEQTDPVDADIVNLLAIQAYN